MTQSIKKLLRKISIPRETTESENDSWIKLDWYTRGLVEDKVQAALARVMDPHHSSLKKAPEVFVPIAAGEEVGAKLYSPENLSDKEHDENDGLHLLYPSYAHHRLVYEGPVWSAEPQKSKPGYIGNAILKSGSVGTGKELYPESFPAIARDPKRRMLYELLGFIFYEDGRFFVPSFEEMNKNLKEAGYVFQLIPVSGKQTEVEINEWLAASPPKIPIAIEGCNQYEALFNHDVWVHLWRVMTLTPVDWATYSWLSRRCLELQNKFPQLELDFHIKSIAEGLENDERVLLWKDYVGLPSLFEPITKAAENLFGRVFKLLNYVHIFPEIYAECFPFGPFDSFDCKDNEAWQQQIQITLKEHSEAAKASHCIPLLLFGNVDALEQITSGLRHFLDASFSFASGLLHFFHTHPLAGMILSASSLMFGMTVYYREYSSAEINFINQVLDALKEPQSLRQRKVHLDALKEKLAKNVSNPELALKIAHVILDFFPSFETEDSISESFLMDYWDSSLNVLVKVMDTCLSASAGERRALKKKMEEVKKYIVLVSTEDLSDLLRRKKSGLLGKVKHYLDKMNASLVAHPVHALLIDVRREFEEGDLQQKISVIRLLSSAGNSVYDEYQSLNDTQKVYVLLPAIRCLMNGEYAGETELNQPIQELLRKISIPREATETENDSWIKLDWYTRGLVEDKVQAALEQVMNPKHSSLKKAPKEFVSILATEQVGAKLYASENLSDRWQQDKSQGLHPAYDLHRVVYKGPLWSGRPHKSAIGYVGEAILKSGRVETDKQFFPESFPAIARDSKRRVLYERLGFIFYEDGRVFVPTFEEINKNLKEAGYVFQVLPVDRILSALEVIELLASHPPKVPIAVKGNNPANLMEALFNHDVWAHLWRHMTLTPSDWSAYSWLAQRCLQLQQKYPRLQFCAERLSRIIANSFDNDKRVTLWRDYVGVPPRFEPISRNTDSLFAEVAWVLRMGNGSPKIYAEFFPFDWKDNKAWRKQIQADLREASKTTPASSCIPLLLLGNTDGASLSKSAALMADQIASGLSHFLDASFSFASGLLHFFHTHPLVGMILSASSLMLGMAQLTDKTLSPEAIQLLNTAISDLNQTTPIRTKKKSLDLMKKELEGKEIQDADLAKRIRDAVLQFIPNGTEEGRPAEPLLLELWKTSVDILSWTFDLSLGSNLEQDFEILKHTLITTQAKMAFKERELPKDYVTKARRYRDQIVPLIEKAEKVQKRESSRPLLQKLSTDLDSGSVDVAEMQEQARAILAVFKQDIPTPQNPQYLEYAQTALELIRDVFKREAKIKIQHSFEKDLYEIYLLLAKNFASTQKIKKEKVKELRDLSYRLLMDCLKNRTASSDSFIQFTIQILNAYLTQEVFQVYLEELILFLCQALQNTQFVNRPSEFETLLPLLRRASQKEESPIQEEAQAALSHLEKHPFSEAAKASPCIPLLLLGNTDGASLSKSAAWMADQIASGLRHFLDASFSFASEFLHFFHTHPLAGMILSASSLMFGMSISSKELTHEEIAFIDEKLTALQGAEKLRKRKVHLDALKSKLNKKVANPELALKIAHGILDFFPSVQTESSSSEEFLMECWDSCLNVFLKVKAACLSASIEERRALQKKMEEARRRMIFSTERDLDPSLSKKKQPFAKRMTAYLDQMRASLAAHSATPIVEAFKRFASDLSASIKNLTATDLEPENDAEYCKLVEQAEKAGNFEGIETSLFEVQRKDYVDKARKLGAEIKEVSSEKHAKAFRLAALVSSNTQKRAQLERCAEILERQGGVVYELEVPTATADQTDHLYLINDSDPLDTIKGSKLVRIYPAYFYEALDKGGRFQAVPTVQHLKLRGIFEWVKQKAWVVYLGRTYVDAHDSIFHPFTARLHDGYHLRKINKIRPEYHDKQISVVGALIASMENAGLEEILEKDPFAENVANLYEGLETASSISDLVKEAIPLIQQIRPRDFLKIIQTWLKDLVALLQAVDADSAREIKELVQSKIDPKISLLSSREGGEGFVPVPSPDDNPLSRGALMLAMLAPAMDGGHSSWFSGILIAIGVIVGTAFLWRGKAEGEELENAVARIQMLRESLRIINQTEDEEKNTLEELRTLLRVLPKGHEAAYEVAKDLRAMFEPLHTHPYSELALTYETAAEIFPDDSERTDEEIIFWVGLLKKFYGFNQKPEFALAIHRCYRAVATKRKTSKDIAEQLLAAFKHQTLHIDIIPDPVFSSILKTYRLLLIELARTRSGTILQEEWNSLQGRLLNPRELAYCRVLLDPAWPKNLNEIRGNIKAVRASITDELRRRIVFGTKGVAYVAENIELYRLGTEGLVAAEIFTLTFYCVKLTSTSPTENAARLARLASLYLLQIQRLKGTETILVDVAQAVRKTFKIELWNKPEHIAHLFNLYHALVIHARNLSQEIERLGRKLEEKRNELAASEQKTSRSDLEDIVNVKRREEIEKQTEVIKYLVKLEIDLQYEMLRALEFFRDLLQEKTLQSWDIPTREAYKTAYVAVIEVCSIEGLLDPITELASAEKRMTFSDAFSDVHYFILKHYFKKFPSDRAVRVLSSFVNSPHRIKFSPITYDACAALFKRSEGSSFLRGLTYTFYDRVADWTIFNGSYYIPVFDHVMREQWSHIQALARTCVGACLRLPEENSLTFSRISIVRSFLESSNASYPFSLLAPIQEGIPHLDTTRVAQVKKYLLEKARLEDTGVSSHERLLENLNAEQIGDEIAVLALRLDTCCRLARLYRATYDHRFNEKFAEQREKREQMRKELNFQTQRAQEEQTRGAVSRETAEEVARLEENLETLRREIQEGMDKYQRINPLPRIIAVAEALESYIYGYAELDSLEVLLDFLRKDEKKETFEKIETEPSPPLPDPIKIVPPPPKIERRPLSPAEEALRKHYSLVAEQRILLAQQKREAEQAAAEAVKDPLSRGALMLAMLAPAMDAGHSSLFTGILIAITTLLFGMAEQSKTLPQPLGAEAIEILKSAISELNKEELSFDARKKTLELMRTQLERKKFQDAVLAKDIRDAVLKVIPDGKIGDYSEARLLEIWQTSLKILSSVFELSLGADLEQDFKILKNALLTAKEKMLFYKDGKFGPSSTTLRQAESCRHRITRLIKKLEQRVPSNNKIGAAKGALVTGLVLGASVFLTSTDVFAAIHTSLHANVGQTLSAGQMLLLGASLLWGMARFADADDYCFALDDESDSEVEPARERYATILPPKFSDPSLDNLSLKFLDRKETGTRHPYIAYDNRPVHQTKIVFYIDCCGNKTSAEEVMVLFKAISSHSRERDQFRLDALQAVLDEFFYHRTEMEKRKQLFIQMDAFISAALDVGILSYVKNETPDPAVNVVFQAQHFIAWNLCKADAANTQQFWNHYEVKLKALSQFEKDLEALEGKIPIQELRDLHTSLQQHLEIICAENSEDESISVLVLLMKKIEKDMIRFGNGIGDIELYYRLRELCRIQRNGYHVLLNLKPMRQLYDPQAVEEKTRASGRKRRAKV